MVRAAPAAIQRSCWRSTPTEERKRSTSEASAAGRLSQCSTTAVMVSTVAAVPAVPASPNGLSKGISVSWSWPAMRLPASGATMAPNAAVATTTRQRGERSRPSGTSRAGRVMPRAIAGAQLNSPVTAASWAASGSGRPARSSWPIHTSQGIHSDQTSPEAANSQPIGLAGRRRPKTSPTLA